MLMRRFAFGVAIAAVALLAAAPSSAYLTKPDATYIIAPYCRTGEWKTPNAVPAGQPLTLWLAYVSKNRGLDEAWIQGTTLDLSIDGVVQTNLDSYYQRPGDYHWPSPTTPGLEELWGIAWAFPVPALDPGESFTYTFTSTTDHRLLDLASPSDGPGKSPYFFERGVGSITCTVTAAGS